MQALFHYCKHIYLDFIHIINNSKHMKVIIRQNKIREMLARKNKSQNWLALRIGVSSGYMSQLIAGSRCPSPKIRESMLEHFPERNFDDLFILENEDN